MSNGRILVIGGAGYVGSHFALHAMKCGLQITVMDNLSTGHRAAARDAEFVKADLADESALREQLSKMHFDGIFHFAASCLVGESVANPSLYYRNNVLSAYTLLEAMRATGHDRLVFSSTCAVYGEPMQVPIPEDHPTQPISPYGRSKLTIEWMLEDYERAYGIRSASLRYFNAAGCEPRDGLGEDHRPETHLIPAVARYALGLVDDLVIFGDDYPTSDGTCVRDYVHVTDLAEAHVKALACLEDVPLIRLNLGTGAGYSNLAVVEAVGRIAGTRLSPRRGPRRPGDPPKLVADASRAANLIGWKPSRSDLERIVSDVIEWFSRHPNGYED
ncbi:MAG: UDP-glucose 4-epimerase GalE [Desulfomonile sp.]|nr:UDP-glucose 4-epimerase GalE [Desulfomonile sp.]